MSLRTAAARLLLRGQPALRRATPPAAPAAPHRSRCFASAAAASVSELVVDNFRPERGGELTVRLVYSTYGDPRDPCILHPTSFDARHPDLEYAIGPGRTLDSSRYFVVVPNMIGNGLSTSPSNTPALRPFPLLTVADNVRLQAQLLQRLRVPRVALCYGYSMGAQQALHWAAAHPATVERVLASCGTASCQPYNAVFLEGLLAVLGPEGALTAPGVAPETRQAALSAFGRVYAGWGLPAEWYRRRLWAQHGYTSLQDFTARSWEAWTTNAQPDDLRAMLRTWRAANVGGREDATGSIDVAAEAEALGRITARCVYMPGEGDRYFPIEEARAEAALVRGAEVVPLSAEWGHRAGDPYRPGQEADARLIRETVQRLLAAPPGGA